MGGAYGLGRNSPGLAHFYSVLTNDNSEISICDSVLLNLIFTLHTILFSFEGKELSSNKRIAR